MNEKYEEIKNSILVLENEQTEQQAYISKLKKQIMDL